MTTLRATRKAQYKQYMVDHVAACSPCTFRSLLNYCRNQGIDAGFTQNFNELKNEGKFYVSEDDEKNLILEIAA